MLKKDVKAICWFVINIILVWTAFLTKITVLSNFALFLIVILSWSYFGKFEKRYLEYIISFIFCLFAYSLIQNNSFASIIRFSIILFFILAVYIIRLPRATVIKGITYTTIPYCVFLILAEFYLVLFFDKSLLSTLRYSVTTSGIGDIYPKYGPIYAVQLVGTAALPFVFMLSYVEEVFIRHKKAKRLILLAGIIIAGNFGFIVAIAVFWILLNLSKKYTYNELFNRFICVVVLTAILGPSMINFVSSTLEQKKEESNATRIEQAQVLMQDMNSSVVTALFGKGLGNTVEIKGKFRDYRGQQYYELQSLYFLNQLGVIPFMIFLIFNIFMTFKYIRYGNLRIVYLCYVLYAITNPYILNTNQVVVIITLVSLSSYRLKQRLNKNSVYGKELGDNYRYCRALQS